MLPTYHSEDVVADISHVYPEPGPPLTMVKTWSAHVYEDWFSVHLSGSKILEDESRMEVDPTTKCMVQTKRPCYSLVL